MRVDQDIRNAQRELAAIKRGMFGGARSHFDSILSSKTFINVSGGQKTITLQFDRKDFPIMQVIILNQGEREDMNLCRRSGRYTWKVYLDPLVTGLEIQCYLQSEQVPTSWTIS